MSIDQTIIARRSVIKMLEIEPEAIDRLEQLQIIIPVRRPKRERAYHQKDIDCLRVYQLLVKELEVNPAGAEIILRMRKQMLEIQRRMGLMLNGIKSQGLLEEIKKILSSIDV